MTSNSITPAPASSVQRLDKSLAMLPAALGEYLEQALGSLEIGLLDASAEDAWAATQRCLAMEAAGKILAGRALTHLRDTLDKRAFSAGLAERGISRSSAYYAIDVYEMFAALPDGPSVHALAQIGATKAMAFRKWAPEQISALAHGEEVNGLTLDQAADLSSRELETLTRQVLQKDAAIGRLESERTRLETELRRLREDARKTRSLQALEDLPPFAREAREEAMVLSEQIMLAVELLEDVAGRCLLAEVDHPERLRWQPAAAATMVHAVGAPLARAAHLLRRLQQAFPTETAGAPDADALLEPGEARLFLTSRDRLTGRAAEAFTARADARANSTPGKRGRKRGGASADASA